MPEPTDGGVAQRYDGDCENMAVFSQALGLHHPW